MAAATKFLAASSGCKVFLNYDDVAMTASGVSVVPTAATETITFTITVGGNTFTKTVSPGQAVATITFPSAVPITTPITFHGTTGFAFGASYSIGTG